jgi:hypothetical protein
MNLGDYSMPYSYIKFLIDEITGIDLDPIPVDYLTVISFILALLISTYVNLNDRKRNRV